ncbi:MAG: hypothetical protein F7C09_01135, partial [Aeropyrum sp.]|nr:hypothetical protein [Aeropyrum sp.]
MTIKEAWRSRNPGVKGKGRLARRGQAEVIGGLIIITIILVIVLPILLNSLSDARSVAQDLRDAETRVDIKLKERLQIRGATQEEAGSLWPAIWIANTGTIEVVPRILYLIDRDTGSILMALDLAYTREGTTPIVRKMLLNPDPSFTTSDPIPPAGE